MTENELRLKATLTAAIWLGTKEGSREHRRILEIYNGIRPLPRGYSMKTTDPWCAAFVSTAALEAGIGGIVPLECSCSRMIALSEGMGIWVEEDAHVPKIGDWILYNWDASKNGDDTGAPDHIGITVGIRDSEISVVEGNYENAVKLRRILINDHRIRGFICPRYDALAKEEEMQRYHTIGEVPAYARETIEKLTDDGSLLGVAEDDLGLSEELVRVLVILDRRGLL